MDVCAVRFWDSPRQSGMQVCEPKTAFRDYSLKCQNCTAPSLYFINGPHQATLTWILVQHQLLAPKMLSLARSASSIEVASTPCFRVVLCMCCSLSEYLLLLFLCLLLLHRIRCRGCSYFRFCRPKHCFSVSLIDGASSG